MEISELIGKTITNIQGGKVGDESVVFDTAEGMYEMHHYQDCCEDVRIDDVCGDIADLIGSPVVKAEEASSEETPVGATEPDQSATWTFYRIQTGKGLVVIRWCGSSNGYYSESVDFERV